MNKEMVEAAGFKVDAGGKIRSSEGRLIKAALAEQVAAGAIVANFDMEALRKKKARTQASGTADMVGALRTISPAIELLEIGQTAKIPMPKTAADGKNPKRVFVMSVVSKLNNLTSAGREWAGKVFDSMADENGEFFYVLRMPDTDEPHVRKTGGRGPGKGKAKENSLDRLNSSLAASRAHLNGSSDNKPEQEVQEQDNETETLEDAQVIQH